MEEENDNQITLDSFNEEQRAFIQSQIEGAQQGVSPAMAVQILKKHGGVGFFSDDSHKNAFEQRIEDERKKYESELRKKYESNIEVTKGNFDRDFRLKIKENTGVDWNSGEAFEDYVSRAFGGNRNKTLEDAFKTKEQTFLSQINELSEKVKEYETKEWNRQISTIKQKALGDNKFSIPQGISDIEQKELLELKQAKYSKAFDERFEISKDEEGNTVLKDKKTNGVYIGDDITKYVQKTLKDFGIAFENGDAQKRSNLPNSQNPNNLDKEQLETAKNKWQQACRGKRISESSKEAIILKREFGLPISDAQKKFAGLE